MRSGRLARLLSALGLLKSRSTPTGLTSLGSAYQARLQAGQDEPLVVCVGRLCYARAPDVAVAALALMRTPAVRLRLVGNGEDRAAIENQTGKLKLTGRVELVGFRADPAPDLRTADVVVVPSRYDAMALVLLEAMACGAAIVATRVAGSAA